MKNQYTITLFSDATLKTSELVIQSETADLAIKDAEKFAELNNLSIPKIDGYPMVIRYNKDKKDTRIVR